MSYDVWLSIDTGAGNYAEVYDANYTSNVSPMWTDALDGVSLASMHGSRASLIAPLLRKAVETMNADPERYAAMNPANGWGDAEGAREFLAKLAEQCERHPATTLGVHR